MAAGGVAIHLVSFVLLLEWSCPENWMKTSVLAQVPFDVGFLYVVALSWCLRPPWPPVPHLPPIKIKSFLPAQPAWIGCSCLGSKVKQPASASREYRSQRSGGR